MDNSDVGTLYVTSRLVGVSVWFQPLNSSEEQKKLGFYDFFSGLSAQMQKWWNEIYVTELSHFLDQVLGVNVCSAVLLRVWWQYLDTF
ncbi:hypothetical protein PILCRDRAFT_816705 [Piloderma croceum F 1598]|uniref:Uncharacterized protein n=1 Tax=Piloderma croceum (strain F 1598) TaxID=765440 RepID=A0A0C3C901_PILCF|nr:hypothetical protein PILCRDRAFT_816705 [Piloderma croceum F 1598]